MGHICHDLPQRLGLKTNALSIFLLVAIFCVLQYIVDMDFVCSCKLSHHRNAIAYMLIPPFVLTWVVFVAEPFSSTSFFSISLPHNNVYGFLLKPLLIYGCLGGVWVSSVLFDGDWFYCLKTNLNANQTGLPCKVNLTFEENKIKAAYKAESRVIGLFTIFGFILLWSAAKIPTDYYVRNKTWKRGSGSKMEMLHPPHYRKVYEDLLAQQVRSHLTNKLTEMATDRAKVICEPYLRTIGDAERPFTNPRDGNDSVNKMVLEAWQKISAPDFPFT